MSSTHVSSASPTVVEKVAFFISGNRRTAIEVLESLRDKVEDRASVQVRHIALVGEDPLSCMGLFERRERDEFIRRERVLILMPPLLIAVLLLGGQLPLQALPPFIALGFGISIIARGVQRRKTKENFLRSLEFHLPMVMERLVMAVQSGLDIMPAVRTVLRVDDGETARKNVAEKLLLWAYRLTTTGQSFEESLNFVATVVESSALRHAFIHMGVAHREGGELSAPLRELSDSTQAYYQESIEEEIAKLPVKATLPLLLTFAGLIATFLAPPLIQLIEFSAKAGTGP